MHGGGRGEVTDWTGDLIRGSLIHFVFRWHLSSLRFLRPGSGLDLLGGACKFLFGM